MRMSVREYVYVHIGIVVYVVAVLYSGSCVLAVPGVRTYADVCVSVFAATVMCLGLLRSSASLCAYVCECTLWGMSRGYGVASRFVYKYMYRQVYEAIRLKRRDFEDSPPVFSLLHSPALLWLLRSSTSFGRLAEQTIMATELSAADHGARWKKLGLFVTEPGGRWLEKIVLDCRHVLRYSLEEERFFGRIDVFVPAACRSHEVLIMTVDFVDGVGSLVPAEPRQRVFFTVRPLSATGISEADLEAYLRLSRAWLPPLMGPRGFVDADVVSFHHNLVLNIRLGNRWTVRRFATNDAYGDIPVPVIDGDGDEGVEADGVRDSSGLDDISTQSAVAGSTRDGGSVERTGDSVETFLRDNGRFETVFDFGFSAIELMSVPFGRNWYGDYFAALGKPVDMSIGASPERVRFFSNPLSGWVLGHVAECSPSSLAYHYGIRRRMLNMRVVTRDSLGTFEKELRQHRRLCRYLDHILGHCDLRNGHSLAIEVCCSQVKALHDRWRQRAQNARAQRNDVPTVIPVRSLTTESKNCMTADLLMKCIVEDGGMSRQEGLLLYGQLGQWLCEKYGSISEHVHL